MRIEIVQSVLVEDCRYYVFFFFRRTEPLALEQVNKHEIPLPSASSGCRLYCDTDVERHSPDLHNAESLFLWYLE